MKRYCLALDLVDDPAMIAEYERHHSSVSPEIRKSILDAGITDMQIYRLADRLFMIMETDDAFSFEKKAAMDEINPMVQEWESLMGKYQKVLPQARPGEKWILLDKIFQL